MPEQRNKFDWDTAKRQLSEAQRRLTGESSPEEVRAVLAERARLLATTSRKDPFSEGERQLITFLSCHERLAFSVEFVRSVIHLESYARVPCAPDFVVGAFNVRGQVYSLVDITRFLGLPVEENHAYRNAMLVEANAMTVGVAVDEVREVVAVLPQELASADPRLNVDAEFVVGITKDLTLVLDLSRIMADERFVVNEGVRFSKRGN